MAFFIGLGIGLSLIIAIGAQNAFVLRQGVRREHVFVVALICAVSDAILISLGVAGVGFALKTVPWLIVVVRLLGVAFLLTYAFLALRRAFRPAADGLVADSSPAGSDGSGNTIVATKTTTARMTLWTTALAAMAITWLNPHVYLDTVIFLGSVAQAQGDGRWLFAIGAFTGSFVWFFALAYGARFLGSALSTPKAWRILDALIGIFMILIALTLAFGI